MLTWKSLIDSMDRTSSDSYPRLLTGIQRKTLSKEAAQYRPLTYAAYCMHLDALLIILSRDENQDTNLATSFANVASKIKEAGVELNLSNSANCVREGEGSLRQTFRYIYVNSMMSQKSLKSDLASMYIGFVKSNLICWMSLWSIAWMAIISKKKSPLGKSGTLWTSKSGTLWTGSFLIFLMKICHTIYTLRIHGTGIFTYIWLIYGKCS